jgi:serine/threonine protein kinase
VGGQVPGDAGAPVGPSVGMRIAGYRLEERVGAGRMAVVFRAVDERLGRQVALKVIAAEMASDDAARYRFLRNSKAVTAAVDPHLLPIYEIGESDGVLSADSAVRDDRLAAFWPPTTLPTVHQRVASRQVSSFPGMGGRPLTTGAG